LNSPTQAQTQAAVQSGNLQQPDPHSQPHSYSQHTNVQIPSPNNQQHTSSRQQNVQSELQLQYQTDEKYQIENLIQQAETERLRQEEMKHKKVNQREEERHNQKEEKLRIEQHQHKKNERKGEEEQRQQEVERKQKRRIEEERKHEQQRKHDEEQKLINEQHRREEQRQKEEYQRQELKMQEEEKRIEKERPREIQERFLLEEQHRQAKLKKCEEINAHCKHGRADSECEMCVCMGNWEGSTCDKCALKCSQPQQIDELCKQCLCPEGFEVDPSDANKCIDIDECSLPNRQRPCDIHVGCKNLIGSFKCGTCPSGYYGNEYYKCYELLFILSLIFTLFIMLIIGQFCSREQRFKSKID